MRAAVLCLGLGLVLLCLLRARAEVPQRLDRSKIEGKWYVVALASDSEGYLKEKDQLKMTVATIKFLADGDMKVSFVSPTPEGCKKREAIYTPTDVPGEYYTENGNKWVRVVDTDAKTYAVVSASRWKDGRTWRMMRLYSKTRYVRPKIAALFRKLARENNFTEEMVAMLPWQEGCSPEEQ